MLKIFLLIIFFISNYAFSADEYFLTLRYDKVNLRQGPSKDHPVKLFYTKKYLPILVQDEFENYRKIRDHENNSGWIHVSQLSKKKAGINIDENLLVYKNPTIFSKPKVILEKGRLCLIKKCKKDWCNITVSKYSGWVKKESLWGKL